MPAKSKGPFHDWRAATALVLLILLFAPRSFAEESYALSGRVSVRGVEELRDDSVPEDPGFSGRIKLDASRSSWRFHSWLEGGWDGAITRPSREHSLFKSFDRVYQDNTPYLEFKEIYLQYSGDILDLRAGIQRFAWGRLDEYPANDLLNPWDFSQFLRKPLEDRKIGVPSLFASLNAGDWTFQAVWVPVLVPYRLSMPDERWAITSSMRIPNVEIIPKESGLPARTAENSNIGLRALHTGGVEWAVDFYHGYDPRPVFRSTSFTVTPLGDKLLIDPGFVPDFHRITSLGLDGALVLGDLSIRADAAYSWNRFFNVRTELWGYPALPLPGVYPLNPAEIESDTLDYGIGADYLPFEDVMVTVQAQQTVIFDRTDALYDRTVETLVWTNLKVGWMNQKIETNVAVAYNPEHGAVMTKANAFYTFTDSWKAGVTGILFDGPPQSFFGRYARNDQVEAEVVYSW
ncbi:MAG TPA: hypothetical protein VN604_02660 [Nitrospirota bacterium]|nr:hypothetical protein [Nitrospirota bacterium]